MGRPSRCLRWRPGWAGGALVVTGRTKHSGQDLLDGLVSEGVVCSPFQVAGEPTTDVAKVGIDLAQTERCDLVIGLGGGSVLDVAKAIAAMLTNEGELFDYLEVIGGGRSPTQRSAPMIAVPTTAGTGSEVTRNAVLLAPEHRVKVSLRGVSMLAHVAVVDPELTHSVPPAVTASTGMDALTQVLEPFVSSRANPMIDALCREGMTRAARSLRRVYLDGTDAEARRDMGADQPVRRTGVG